MTELVFNVAKLQVNFYNRLNTAVFFYQNLSASTLCALKGDVDGNGTVNVNDVTALVNMILGVIPKEMARADVDVNGVVNVSDVTALVNLILGVS